MYGYWSVSINLTTIKSMILLSIFITLNAFFFSKGNYKCYRSAQYIFGKNSSSFFFQMSIRGIRWDTHFWLWAIKVKKSIVSELQHPTVQSVPGVMFHLLLFDSHKYYKYFKTLNWKLNEYEIGVWYGHLIQCHV